MKQFARVGLFAVTFASCISITIAQEAYVDIITLKDGTVLEGRILTELQPHHLEKQVLVLQRTNPNGFHETLEIPWNKIQDVNRKTLYYPIQKTIRRKDKYFAGCSSFILPGLGHFYAEEPEKGMMFSGTGILGWTLLITAANDNRGSIDYDRDDSLALFGFILLLGATVFSVIDAIDSVEEFNVQIARSSRQVELPFVILPGTPKSYREGEPGDINYQPESAGNEEEKAGATLRIPF